MSAFLEVAGASKAFGGIHAVEDMDFAVAEGEICGVIGPNGSGKTTLLGLLSGTYRPDRGTIRLKGRRIDRLSAHRTVQEGVARTFQTSRLLFRWPLAANLAAAAAARPIAQGGPTAEPRELLALVGLMSRPQLLLMDEPSSGLSPIAIRQVRDILLQVRGAGMAILLVEQNVPLAVEISQRCYLLNRGLIEAAGATSDLMQDPALADAYLGGAGETSGSRQPTADNHPKEDAMSEGPVMSGAEPFFLRGGDTGILLSHGFTGTTQSMRYLGEALHRLGYTVSAPRLKGHGISPAAMAKSTAGEWVASLEDALAELRPQCKRVFIGGLSMGGALTLYMAGKHAGVFAGAFPINAVVHVDSPDLAGLAFDRNAPPAIPGVGSDIKDPAVKELAYPEVPVPAIKELFALIAVTRELLPRITCPTLILQSRDDHVVPPGNGKTIAGGVGAARVELVWLENSFHVATIDYDKDRIIAEVHRFIQSVLAS
jgi:carboxylesterase